MIILMLFILPMEDVFRNDNIQYLEGATYYINKLEIPCYVIGGGHFMRPI